MKFNIAQFQATTKLPLTAEFVVNVLGIKPDEQVKRSMLWDRNKYGLILGRLANYMNGLGALDPTAAEKKVRVKAADAEGTQQSADGTPADDPFADDPDAVPVAGGDASDPFAEAPVEENLW